MEENCKKQQKKNKLRQKGAKGTEAIVKGWQLNDFVDIEKYETCYLFWYAPET